MSLREMRGNDGGETSERGRTQTRQTVDWLRLHSPGGRITDLPLLDGDVVRGKRKGFVNSDKNYYLANGNKRPDGQQLDEQDITNLKNGLDGKGRKQKTARGGWSAEIVHFANNTGEGVAEPRARRFDPVRDEWR